VALNIIITRAHAKVAERDVVNSISVSPSLLSKTLRYCVKFVWGIEPSLSRTRTIMVCKWQRKMFS